MNSTDSFNQLLHEWLADAAPKTTPRELHSGAMAQARDKRQRMSWSAALHGTLARQGDRTIRIGTLARGAALAAATALIGIMLAGGFGSAPTPEPTESPTPRPQVATPPPQRQLNDGFTRHFFYTAPPGVTPYWVSRQPTLTGFVDPAREGPLDDTSYSGLQNISRRGIVLAWLKTPWVHSCGANGGRVAIRNSPADFLVDLEEVAGVALAATTDASVDGRAAIHTMVTPSVSACDADLHIDPIEQGIGNAYFLLTKPSQLLVFDVEGRTIFIDIWAQTDAELEAWLPTAMEFVNSIHFIPVP